MVHAVTGSLGDCILLTERRMRRLLSLFTSGLAGTLPRSITAMTALVSLSLQGNSLSGTLPSFLALMPWLEYVVCWRLPAACHRCLHHTWTVVARRH